ncbi:hypothetical protein BN59_00327 [Legionella massiliensis]|uniref:Uncharacterized protein n=1 Tax=Legionella massiliensis TaxID=1034943 RepID=A0A078KWI8_9GAMM|nr:hypothetical protein BN59_00327 [Legionella massiliensis]CEE11801.1 hypothetical protein BN1094_00327 [Legionella massiliensis]
MFQWRQVSVFMRLFDNVLYSLQKSSKIKSAKLAVYSIITIFFSYPHLVKSFRDIFLFAKSVGRNVFFNSSSNFIATHSSEPTISITPSESDSALATSASYSGESFVV